MTKPVKSLIPGTEACDGSRGKGSVKPLSATWRMWLEKGRVKEPDCQEPDRQDFDAIVVGSGYGGSVTALRLIEKGYRVLLLERGSEFLTGDFPSEAAQISKFVRLDIPGTRHAAMSPAGLVEFHLGQGMVAVTGNGLGGGSLINAGVAIRPDDDVLGQDAWPAAIRKGLEHGHIGMDAAYKLALMELKAQRWDDGTTVGGAHRILKAEAMGRMGAKWKKGPEGGGIAVEHPDLTIDPENCKRCGDCATGCNVKNAKRSLDHTYLDKAVKLSDEGHHGQLQILTQADVYRFAPVAIADAGKSTLPMRWELTVFPTNSEAYRKSIAEVATDQSTAGWTGSVRANMLFLCAGTYGSTLLMQRSAALSKGDLRFSGALGQNVSSNGDSLSLSANEALPVNAVGAGVPQGNPPGAVVGPTITRYIDLRKGDRPLTKRLLVEDAAIPRPIAEIFREIIATTWTLGQSSSPAYFTPRKPAGAKSGEDPLAASVGVAEHTQVLLTMGHDGSPGRLVWMEDQDCNAAYVPDPERLDTYVEQQRRLSQVPGKYFANPVWQLLPDAATNLLSGRKPPHTIMTVHPLGGCVMGDDPAASVVDHLGRVWVRDPGALHMEWLKLQKPGIKMALPWPGPAVTPPISNEPVNGARTYDGLYVLDGSIIPTSLGCNPFLTITALAERALSAIQPRTPPAGATRPDTIRLPEREPPFPKPLPYTVDGTLSETLACKKVYLRGALAGVLAGQRLLIKDWSEFTAKFHTEDFAETMRSKEHIFQIREAALNFRTSQGETIQYQVKADKPGEFHALPAHCLSSGWWPLVWAVLQVVVQVVGSLWLLWQLPTSFSSKDLWLTTWVSQAVQSIGIPYTLMNYLALVCDLASRYGFALICLVALLSFFLMPFQRTVLTWCLVRYLRERRNPYPTHRTVEQWWQAVVSGFYGLVNASEKRTMTYGAEMVLDLEHQKQYPELPKVLVLKATKRVAYRATCTELLQMLLQQSTRNGGIKQRTTYWEQVMNALMEVREPGKENGRALAKGLYCMGFENLAGAKPAGQLGLRGDLTTGVIGLLSYPALFLRFAIKTRLLDFRLPTYSERPCRDDAPPQETTLFNRKAGSGTHQKVEPVAYQLSVPRGESSGDDGTENQDPIQLTLRRYRQPGGLPAVDNESWLGIKVRRARSVLLLHAFGQSGLCFTFSQTEENLAEAFYKEGYEVWILESRMSTRGDHCRQAINVDMLGQHDVPEAVKFICEKLKNELGGQDEPPVQIAAFAQCIGAASLWMALLSGRLSHNKSADAPARPGEATPQLSMISHAMFSQVHAWPEGRSLTRAKTWIPAFLQTLSDRLYMPFAVRGPQNLMGNLMDRLFATLPAPREERAAYKGYDDAAATCQRIRFVEAPLFNIENLNEDTFGAMPNLFGDTSLRLFDHSRRFVEKRALVDENGYNVYLSENNFHEHLAFPIQLMHGEENQLFDPSSAKRTFANLERLLPGWQAFAAAPDCEPGPMLIPGFGHLDVLIGKNAPTEVYPKVVGFFTHMTKTPAHQVAQSSLPKKSHKLHAPELGPMLGWVRRDNNGKLLARVSFKVSDGDDWLVAANDISVIVRQEKVPDVFVQVAPVQVQLCPSIAYSNGFHRLQNKRGYLMAWVDLEVVDSRPPLHASGHRFQVLTWHKVHAAASKQQPPDDSKIDRWIRRSCLPASHYSFSVSDAAVQSTNCSDTNLTPVRFAVSTCRYPGANVDADRVDWVLQKVLEGWANEPPAFCLLVGDQIYADATAGRFDPVSPFPRFPERHVDAFGTVPMRELLRTVPTYMTPDDHELINNCPSEQAVLTEPWPDPRPTSDFSKRKSSVWNVANEAVTMFQLLQSPLEVPGRAGVSTEYYTLEYSCVRIFVMDTRRHRKLRTLNNAPHLVTSATMNAFEQWLTQSQSSGKFTILASGSVVLPDLIEGADPANPEPADNWRFAQEQQKKVLSLLHQYVAGRYMVLSGDYHVSVGYEIRNKDKDKTEGISIVCPPLYSPMPFANTLKGELDDARNYPINPDGALCLHTIPGSQFEFGSGLCELIVEPHSNGGGYRVEFKRTIWTWEGSADQKDGEPRTCKATFSLP